MFDNLCKYLGLATVLLVCNLSAQPLVGTWFEPTAIYRACLMNPAMPCPQTNYGASEQEKALRTHAYSVLRFEQAQLMTLHDSNSKLSDAQGLMDFRMRFATPLGTTIGFGAAIPHPSRKFILDSTQFSSWSNPGQATLLLGSDLLGMGGNAEQNAHQFLVSAELPIAYDPGLWAWHAEWVWKAGLRLRASHWRVTPREDLVRDQDVERYRMRWHEAITQGLIAARPIAWLELGVRATRSQVTPINTLGQATVIGDVWQGAGSAQVVGKNWRWSQNLEWQQEALQYSWIESVVADSIPAWSLEREQRGAVWVYNSRLQRTLGIWRVALWGERRLWDGWPGAWSQENGSSESSSWMALLPFHETTIASIAPENGLGRMVNNLVGSEIRWNGDGFYIEPGIAYSIGQLDSLNESWATWGMQIAVNPIPLTYDALIGSINIGFSGGGNRFQYTWRQAFPMDGSPWQNGLTASWGALHRFTIEGGF
jgi:hypothetical protein